MDKHETPAFTIHIGLCPYLNSQVELSTNIICNYDGAVLSLDPANSYDRTRPLYTASPQAAQQLAIATGRGFIVTDTIRFRFNLRYNLTSVHQSYDNERTYIQWNLRTPFQVIVEIVDTPGGGAVSTVTDVAY
jgi:hypothetical protein